MVECAKTECAILTHRQGCHLDGTAGRNGIGIKACLRSKGGGMCQCRFLAEMDETARLYGERYPLDEDLLSALAQMPQSSGCAMGFDRLVMLATGAPRIDDVLWAPVG